MPGGAIVANEPRLAHLKTSLRNSELVHTLKDTMNAFKETARGVASSLYSRFKLPTEITESVGWTNIKDLDEAGLINPSSANKAKAMFCVGAVGLVAVVVESGSKSGSPVLITAGAFSMALVLGSVYIVKTEENKQPQHS